MELDEMLKAAYSEEKVPEDLNIRLKNQIACREVMKEKSISFWWLPAVLSTILAVAGFSISFLLYMIICLLSSCGKESSESGNRGRTGYKHR